MKKGILGVFCGAIIIGILFLININTPSQETEGPNTLEESAPAEVETIAEPEVEEIDSENDKEERETDLKELVENQFEYFDSHVNGNYFRNARRNGPDGNYSDGWVTAKVADELQQRAAEIDKFLPEEISSTDSTSQDLLNVLIRINQAASLTESQKNVYHIYRTLYNLHVSLNGYELEEGKFDPEEDWGQVFDEDIDQTVKTEAELRMETAEEETE
ncbi:hypothetical protein WQ54_07030 [Bacillus sp. SA1-12]|uniref:hypothetical protein n=1 Tax=Bacillus sp. SA1-12 TaxID=1455638 RepID=UPI000626598A|nr:hypothetical protein [Bacillus sp. SA1-12]KKI92923.1 hypothetical protein WQ54_07030 [Bacillus sp. SA1-12]